MKKRFLLALLFLISFLLLSGCSKKEYEEDCLRFGVLRVEDALPVFAAEELGLFNNEVEVIIFSNTREMDLALEAGVIDGILTDIVRSILLKNGEEDIRIVASASPTPALKRKFAIVSSPNSGIDTYEDIQNSEIGISENSITTFLMDKMLQAKNIDKKDIVIKSLPDIKLRFEAILSDSLETALLPEPLVSYAVQEGSKVLISDIELDKDYSQTVFVFRLNYINENKEKIEKFFIDVISAGEMLNKNPEKYLSLVAEKAGLNEKILDDKYKIYSIENILIPDESIIEDVNTWMISNKILDKKYDYNELVTKEFKGE